MTSRPSATRPRWWTRSTSGTSGGQLISSRINTSGESYYDFFDAQGSITGLIDPNGNLRATFFQDPYGAFAGEQAHNGAMPRNPWRFAGGYLDNGSFLYKFGHRYYDPTLGRWTQPDPLTILGDPANASPYAYVGGDPVNRVDPTGLSTCGDFSVGGVVDCVANPTSDEARDALEELVEGINVSAATYVGVTAICVAVAGAITTGGTAGYGAPAFLKAVGLCDKLGRISGAAAKVAYDRYADDD